MMANYQPMSRDTLLARGSCCNLGCFHCPYRPPSTHPPLNIDPEIESALRSGTPTTIYSNRMSLTPQLTIQNVTIIYKKYEKQ